MPTKPRTTAEHRAKPAMRYERTDHRDRRGIEFLSRCAPSALTSRSALRIPPRALRTPWAFRAYLPGRGWLTPTCRELVRSTVSCDGDGAHRARRAVLGRRRPRLSAEGRGRRALRGARGVRSVEADAGLPLRPLARRAPTD